MRRDHSDFLKGAQHSGLFAERVYAQGGLVVTEYVNLKKGTQEKVVMNPGEALRRAHALCNDKVPREFVPHDLIQAIMRAASAAKQDTIEGHNPLYEANRDLYNVKKQAAEIESEIAAERKNNPELDEEMARMEKEYGLKKIV